MRDKIFEVCQSYLGSNPSDKNCKDWNELAETMTNDIMVIIDQDTSKDISEPFDHLLDCDNRKFSAIIDDDYCEGIISVEHEIVFLCQNKIDGEDCDDKKGYNYSFNINSGTKVDLVNENITNFKLLD